MRLLFYILFSITTSIFYGQTPPCDVNIDFEDGSISGWNESSSQTNTYYFNNCCFSPSYVSSMTYTAMSNDFFTNIPVVAPNGGNFSVKLGPSLSTSLDKTNKLEKYINVTANNFLFTYDYAIVLAGCTFYPAHGTSAAMIVFTDQNGDTIPCTKEYFNARDNHATGFSVDTTVFSGNIDLYYLPWQSKTIDLSAYIGQFVTASFLVKKCDGGAHFAYMYFDFECNAQIPQTLCSGNNLCAPLNCPSYFWTTPTGSHPVSPCIPSSQAGLYTVEIPVQKGCVMDTAVFTYTVTQQPITDFSFQTSCQSLDYIFSDLSTMGPDTVCSRQWTIQNSAYSTTGFNYHFNTPGTYTVSLVTEDCNHQCSDTIVKNISVSPPLIAGFNIPTTGCENELASFINSSSGTHTPTYLWDFGFTQSNVTNPVTSYNNAGTYPVKLLVQDSLGCKDSLVRLITIHPPPKIKIIAGNVCYKSPSIFEAITLDTTSVVQWQWDFEYDGVPESYSQNTQTVYYSYGSYWVGLQAVSAFGCIGKDSVMINVHPLPIADYAINTSSSPQIVFSNTSTTPGNSFLTSSLWDFGEGALQNSMLPDINYAYSQPGDYTTALSVTNNFGCVSTIIQSVIIASGYGIYIPNAFTPNSDGLNDLFKIEYFGIEDFELTIFDRWGELIFRTEDKDSGWNGVTKRGTSCKEGVYIWKINFVDFVEKKHTMTGHVTLIK